MEQFNKFEQSMRLAFDEAQIAPSPQVWENIGLELSKSASNSNRKRLLVLQLVAAASLLFATTIGVYQFVSNSSDSSAISAESTNPSDAKDTSNDQKTIVPILTPSNNEDKEGATGPSDQSLAKSEETNNQSAELEIMDQGTDESLDDIDVTPSVIVIPAEDQNVPHDLVAANSSTELERIGSLKSNEDIIQSIDLNRSPLVVDSDLDEMDLLFIPAWKKKEDGNSRFTRWASAGFAAGSYGAGSGGLGFAAQEDALALDGSEDSQNVTASIYSNETSGRTVGASFGYGGRVARKWILESGLGYSSSTIDGVTNAVQDLGDESVPVFHTATEIGDVTTGNSYDISNNFQFLNVPVKAGYIILDKKVGIVATGGVGSNILLSSNVNSDRSDLARLEQSGANSPYRSVSLTGIIGTQFYLNLMENYQLLLSPQYNFGITELTKEESSFTIIPNSFNIGVTFRYMLN